jgi:hypothetical protein
MRPVGSVSGTSAIRVGTSQSLPSPNAKAAPTPPEPTRALVSLAEPLPIRDTPQRTSADFLAHLIATADQLPQTRERRRAEPQHAIAAYVTTARGNVPPRPQKLFRAS